MCCHDWSLFEMMKLAQSSNVKILSKTQPVLFVTCPDKADVSLILSFICGNTEAIEAAAVLFSRNR